MKIKYVDVVIKNFQRKDIKIKLPKKNKDLQKVLIKTEVTEIDKSAIKDLDNILKSVVDIEIKNFKIKKPTNIYYLNCYLEILKEQELDLPEDYLEINTSNLKKMIADLLGSENKNMSLEEIYEVINKDLPEAKNIKENEGMKERPRFSIKELQRKYRERKGK